VIAPEFEWNRRRTAQIDVRAVRRRIDGAARSRFADPGGPPLILDHRSCGHPAAPVLVCEHCREPIDPRDVDPRPGPGFEPPGESRAADEQAS
jgi:hypothetical protein